MVATMAGDDFTSTESTIPVGTTVGIVAGSEMAATMSAIVGHIHPRMTVVEMCVMIVGIDGEIPAGSTPQHRTQEIVGCHKQSVLPVIQDVAEVGTTIAEADTIQVSTCVQAKQIIHIDLISIVVLVGIEVELVCHLVGKIESLPASLFVTHGLCGYTGDENHHERSEIAFHIVLLSLFNVV